MTTEQQLTPTYLGYANGWSEAPAIINSCQEQFHTRYWTRTGPCEHKVECPICGYSYKVDSSD